MQADKRRLARVIANLLDNAAKYGGGATAREPAAGSTTACRSPSRTAGPGVPDEDREQIFDRFARGGVAGRRGAGEGVGLGLALVAEHVRLHGGRVWVEDRADGAEGARFVVELPTEEDSREARVGAACCGVLVAVVARSPPAACPTTTSRG